MTSGCGCYGRFGKHHVRSVAQWHVSVAQSVSSVELPPRFSRAPGHGGPRRRCSRRRRSRSAASHWLRSARTLSSTTPSPSAAGSTVVASSSGGLVGAATGAAGRLAGPPSRTTRQNSSSVRSTSSSPRTPDDAHRSGVPPRAAVRREDVPLLTVAALAPGGGLSALLPVRANDESETRTRRRDSSALGCGPRPPGTGSAISDRRCGLLLSTDPLFSLAGSESRPFS